MNSMLFEMKRLKEQYYDKCYYESMIEYSIRNKDVKIYFNVFKAHYDYYYLPSQIMKDTDDFDKIIKHISKQNKQNKKIINKVKIFTKKRKLCNDIRNIIISFLITTPKNLNLQYI